MNTEKHMENDVFEKAKNPEHPDAAARLAEHSSPMLDRQVSQVEHLNGQLAKLSRTGLLLLGIEVSALGLMFRGGQEALPGFQLMLWSLSGLFFLSSAVLGMFLTRNAIGYGLSDRMYRKAIEEPYDESKVNGVIALISGNHMARNFGTIHQLNDRIDIVKSMLFSGVLTAATAVVATAISDNPSMIVVLIGEVAVFAYFVSQKLRESRRESEEFESSEFPEFHNNA